ncbi:MAG: sulfite exporter TauE/SafE family protein, partial [Alloacidobacterium sp.]
LEAVATTKLLNIFSSSVSTGVFIWHGLVDYRLGLILGAAMFVGAFVGARLAIRIGNEWLLRIFLTSVWMLVLKALLFDVMGAWVHCNVPALGHNR